MVSVPLSAHLHTLSSADGSATYVSPGGNHTIIAGVNYPIEVPYRSSEIPESTFIEVNLRPHNGVGMVKERHVEQLVRKTLGAIVLGTETPRTMLQVTLQITDVKEDETLPGGVKGGSQGESYSEILTGAINTAVLGCLDAGVHMSGLAAAVLVGILRNGTLMAWPSPKEQRSCTSLHVFGFNSRGGCILMESEGSCGLDQWLAAEEVARAAVFGDTIHRDKENGQMEEVEQKSILDIMRNSVEARMAQNERWRDA